MQRAPQVVQRRAHRSPAGRSQPLLQRPHLRLKVVVADAAAAALVHAFIVELRGPGAGREHRVSRHSIRAGSRLRRAACTGRLAAWQQQPAALTSSSRSSADCCFCSAGLGTGLLAAAAAAAAGGCLAGCAAAAGLAAGLAGATAAGLAAGLTGAAAAGLATAAGAAGLAAGAAATGEGSLAAGAAAAPGWKTMGACLPPVDCTTGAHEASQRPMLSGHPSKTSRLQRVPCSAAHLGGCGRRLRG